MFIILRIFFATCGNRQDLPFCHMSITSKFVSWLPKSPRQISLQVESGAALYIENTIVEFASRKRPVKKSKLNLQSNTTLPVVFAGFHQSAFFANLTLNGASNEVVHNH